MPWIPLTLLLGVIPGGSSWIIMLGGASGTIDPGTSAGVPLTEGLPVIVFASVLTTILVFAAGFPVIRRRMGACRIKTQALEPPSRGAG